MIQVSDAIPLFCNSVHTAVEVVGDTTRNTLNAKMKPMYHRCIIDFLSLVLSFFSFLFSSSFFFFFFFSSFLLLFFVLFFVVTSQRNKTTRKYSRNVGVTLFPKCSEKNI